MKIILASASPRRKELLESIGLDFSIVPSSYEEEQGLDLDPAEYVKYLSMRKGKQVSEQHSGLIISADTVVVCEGQIIGKPKNMQHAFEILSLLSDNIHSVFTGYTIIENLKIISKVVETKVYFHKMSDDEINEYINTGESMGKAGAYAIQGLGQKYIKKIEGCYHNVVGLPLPSLIETLKEFNIQISAIPNKPY
jgi:septum formation protein